ncbi:hypothetical protein [Alteribacter keqinensis]|uniref:Uncharacterized protein n=1 Tax=Alteribacter keqinensis TaxID=2483800 RepID=A0A3M7TXJ8_9BACI|nr:hypothetical protein [Alteribacter keqinensis]RNA70337.1 hypothetical protein EBO34_10545 [Alteribacter keqinensis]
MKSSRLFLCVLLTFLLLYLALPRLPFAGEGLAVYFAYAWLGFALIVLGGNVYGWLTARDKERSDGKEEAVPYGSRNQNRGRKKLRGTS